MAKYVFVTGGVVSALGKGIASASLGNLLKATRFGWVIRAMHGTRFLDYQELRHAYSGTLVDLSDDRYVFLNTLFSLSEATLFAQLVVDLRLIGWMPENGDPTGIDLGFLNQQEAAG